MYVCTYILYIWVYTYAHVRTYVRMCVHTCVYVVESESDHEVTSPVKRLIVCNVVIGFCLGVVFLGITPLSCWRRLRVH